MKAIAPIQFTSAAGEIHADTQALIAATLTLMTVCARGGEAMNDASVDRIIAANLQQLAQRAELSDEFRRLCGRLHALWVAEEDDGDA